MPSVTVISSFRVLLSNLLDKQGVWSDDELDEMIHYLLEKDLPNIELFEEELSQKLVFLMDTMEEENLSTVEGLLGFFKIKNENVIKLIQGHIKKKSRQNRMVMNIDGVTIFIDLDKINAMFSAPLISSDFEKEVRGRIVTGGIEELMKSEMFKIQFSRSKVSADGYLSLVEAE